MLKRKTTRTVFLVYVVGKGNSGKTAFLQSFVDRYVGSYSKDEIFPVYSINSVQVKKQEAYIIVSTLINIWVKKGSFWWVLISDNKLNTLSISLNFSMSKSLFDRCKFQLWNAITGDWLKLIAKFNIPSRSKFYPLSKNSRAFLMILPVEGATALANALSVILKITHTDKPTTVL